MVYVHLADGFEEIEAITIMDILRRAEIEVTSVTINDDLFVIGAHDIIVQADMTYEDADYDECNMIVLPGGMGGTLNLEKHTGLKENLLSYAQTGKWIAAICAAPLILGHHGILKDKKATIYPGLEEELIDAKITEGDVVVDDKLVTSRGPATAMDFALKLVELLKNKETADKLADGLLK